MTFDRVIAVRNTKTVYRNGEVCIKVFNEGYNKSEILNEALNHVRMEETGMTVPEFLEVREVDGKWSIVTRYIKGKTLAALMKENPEKIDEYMDRFVDIHVDIMSRKCKHLNRLTDKLNTKISDVNLDATLRYDLHARLSEMPRRENICHGDLNPTNIIVTDDNKAFIVDWSNVCKGNMLADIANTYLLYVLDSNKETAEKYLDAICNKMEMSREKIDGWIPIIAAAKTVHANREKRNKLFDILRESSVIS